MRRLFRTIGWNLLLQLRYQIITVAIVITAAYTLVFKLLAKDGFDEVLDMLEEGCPIILQTLMGEDIFDGGFQE